MEIAQEKANFAYNQLGQPVIVIDGAFHIRALNDFPKTMVKFTEKYLGARGILKLMEGEANRAYQWPNALCYKDGEREKCFVGYIRGIIATTIPDDTKDNDFGIIQVADGYTKSFSQMTEAEVQYFAETVWQPTLFKEFSEWYEQK